MGSEGLIKIKEQEWRDLSKKTLLYKLYKAKSDSSKPNANYQVWSINEDKNNRLWIGNNRDISLYDPQTDNFKHLYFTSSSKSLKFDAVGNLWVATRGEGLFFYNTKTGIIKHYTTANGLIQNFIFDMVIDKNKNLWLTTEIGLSKFNPQTETFRDYDADDGLPSNPFNDHSIKNLPNGKVYIGTSNGFIIFRPENIIDDTSKARVVLTAIKLFNKPIEYSFVLGNKNIINGPIGEITELELTSKQRDNLFLEFAALNYSAALKTKYKYILEGLDNSWTETDANHRVVRYTNLSEGVYYFKVKATNGDGVWNETPYILKIVVHPPFFKSRIFLISVFLIFTILLFQLFQLMLKKEKRQKKELALIIKERTAELSEKNQLLRKNASILNEANKLLKENQQYIKGQNKELELQRDELKQLNSTKDKLLSIIAHDLKNPFNILIGFSNILIENFHKYNDNRKLDILQMLFQSAKTGHLLLDNLLLWSRSQSGNIQFTPTRTTPGEIVNLTLLQIKSFASYKNITIDYPLEDANITITADINMINTVLRNLISNAIKFSQKGSTIIIETKSSDHNILFRIKDSGTGMTQDAINNLFIMNKTVSEKGTAGESGTGLGLIICKEFIEKHNGQIWAESEEGKGSTFSFTLPIG
jgi:signal transduction histidine kinase